MPPASRVFDIALGHDSFPPTPVSAGSPDVKTESLPQARKDDPCLPHDSYSPSPSHDRTISAGSSTVKVNSKPASRLGDAIDCGGLLCSGAGTVIIGG